MAGKSPVTASDEQRAGLLALADSRDRGEADRARAVLLTLAGWTSSKIGEAFGVRDEAGPSGGGAYPPMNVFRKGDDSRAQIRIWCCRIF